MRGPYSTFPAADDPALFLSAFSGDLGLDTGVPQSVYTLDTSEMEQLGLKSLFPGEMWTLPSGVTVEFTGFDRWASFQIASDPGTTLALLSAAAAIAGLMLSLFVKRRRIWIKVLDDPAAATTGTLVQVGALAKTDADDVSPDVAAIVATLASPDFADDKEGTA